MSTEARRKCPAPGSKVRFDAARKQWRVFDGMHWALDEAGVVVELAKESAVSLRDEPPEDPKLDAAWHRHIKHSESRSGIENALKLASSIDGIVVRRGGFDSNVWLFNTLSGTIDLRDGTLYPHRREDLITFVAPTHYDPKAECPTWLEFLDTSNDKNEDLIGYLQRLIGYFLTGDITTQTFPIFYGEGGNGKNVCIDTIAGMMGEYAVKAPDSLFANSKFQEHSTELAGLRGKRFVYGSETEAGQDLKMQMVKRVTGDPTINARLCRKDFEEFPRTFKVLLITNNKPKIKEDTNAVWRRINVYPWTVIIPADKVDTQLTNKLKAEWPGILAWAVRGCLAYQREGLNPPGDVRIATEAYRQDQNRLADFHTEWLIEDHSQKGAIPKANAYESYKTYCSLTGEKDPMSQNDFNAAMAKIPRVEDKAHWYSDTKKSLRSFVGIRLRKEEDGPAVADAAVATG
jgi:putative DNA primase/helicase